MRIFTPFAIPIFKSLLGPPGQGRFDPFRKFDVYYDFPPVPGFHVMGSEVQSSIFGFTAVMAPAAITDLIVTKNTDSSVISNFGVSKDTQSGIVAFAVTSPRGVLQFEVLKEME